MNSLPPALGGDGVVRAWRLDRAAAAAGWDSGEGAWLFGGRWNSVGQRAVYLSLDPATTILEKAVHTGFAHLDAVAHVLTSVVITDPAVVQVIRTEKMPDPVWSRPGVASEAQQKFGDALLRAHAFIAVASVVSQRSWNLVFDPLRAQGQYRLEAQEAFVLDGRLARVARAR